MYCASWGVANGLSFFAAMHQGWRFFPDKPGLASGLIISGFGTAGFVFNQLSTKIINPDNVKVNDPTYHEIIVARFPIMMMTLIYCWWGIIFVGLIMVFKAPS
jgi:hypothetical protein